MKTNLYRRSFLASTIAFGAMALLTVGVLTAYIGTRKVGFNSHTTLIELYDINTVRIMDWYFDTDFFEGLIMFIIKHLPI